jgi:hypothetical protein
MDTNTIFTRIDNKNDMVLAIVLAKSIRKKSMHAKLVIHVPFKNKRVEDCLKYYFDNIVKTEDLHGIATFISCNSIVTADVLAKQAKGESPSSSTDYEGNDFKKYDIIRFNALCPYPLENDVPIEQRVTIPILIYWFYLYKTIINDNPEFYRNKLFKPTNEVFQYFFVQLSHSTPSIINSFNSDLKENIKQLYGIDVEKNMQLYHLDISKEYDSFEINFANPAPNTTIIVCVGEKIQLEPDMKKNVDYKKDFLIRGDILKNILFNIQIQYTYAERIETLNKMFDDRELYFVRLIVFKTLYDVDIEKNGFSLMCYSHAYDKLRILSMLMNEKTYDKMNAISLQTVSELNKLKYQSVKKWIYSVFDGDEVQNLIIVKLDFNNIDTIMIINNNDVTIADMKRINNKKIEFVNVFYAKDAGGRHEEYEEIVRNMYDVGKYYLFDGLKVHELC